MQNPGPRPRPADRKVRSPTIGVHVTACKALRWVGSSRGLEAILFHSRLHPGPKCGPQGTVTLSDLGRGDTRIHGRMGVEVSFSKDKEGWVFSTRFLFLKAVRRRGERYEMVGLVLLNKMRLMAHKKGTPLARFQFAVWGQQEAVSPARGEVSEGWGPVCPSDTSDLPPGPGAGASESLCPAAHPGEDTAKSPVEHAAAGREGAWGKATHRPSLRVCRLPGRPPWADSPGGDARKEAPRDR